MNIFEDRTVFSRKLKEEMLRSGYRQTDISKKTGIPISTISRYLSGEILPGVDYANRIANVFGVKPMWLFGYEDSNEEYNHHIKNCRVRENKILYEQMMNEDFGGDSETKIICLLAMQQKILLDISKSLAIIADKNEVINNE